MENEMRQAADELRVLAQTLGPQDMRLINPQGQEFKVVGIAACLERAAVLLEPPPSLSAAVQTLEKALEHMDRAGGDRDGMPQCPWCHYGPENDGTHAGDCELVAARDALATLRQREPFDRTHDQEELCQCGHPYGRHFDCVENYEPGCKYCECRTFVARQREDTTR